MLPSATLLPQAPTAQSPLPPATCVALQGTHTLAPWKSQHLPLCPWRFTSLAVSWGSRGEPGPNPGAGEEEAGWEHKQAGTQCRNSGQCETFAPRGGCGGRDADSRGCRDRDRVGESGKQPLSQSESLGVRREGRDVESCPLRETDCLLEGRGLGGAQQRDGRLGRSQPGGEAVCSWEARKKRWPDPSAGSPSPQPLPTLLFPWAPGPREFRSSHRQHHHGRLSTGDCTILLSQQGGSRDCTARKSGGLGLGGFTPQLRPGLCYIGVGQAAPRTIEGGSWEKPGVMVMWNLGEGVCV